jgi:hypothetical protein
VASQPCSCCRWTWPLRRIVSAGRPSSGRVIWSPARFTMTLVCRPITALTQHGAKVGHAATAGMDLLGGRGRPLRSRPGSSPRVLRFGRDSREGGGGSHPGRCGGWTGRTYRPTWSGSARVIAIQPHRNDEVEVLVVIVSGRGELTLDGQVHQLAPMVVAHLPKGTVRAIAAVDGPLAYLSLHRRRSAGLQVGGHAQRR